jgi:dephospho-CoA kinase
MPVFALTGELACGKSTVISFLKQKGAIVFDADECVHRFYEDRQCGVYKKVVKSFPSVVNRGTIRRDVLGKIVFNDPAALKRLECIVHPAVEDELKKWVKKFYGKPGIFIAEIPLLFENKLDRLFNGAILIIVEKGILVKRIIKERLLTKEEALRRLMLFMPIEAKQARADYVIENNKTKIMLKKEVNLLWKQLEEVH